MKRIKIKICNYDRNDKFSYGNFLIKILNKYYNVELSENPDYIFYNESTYEYLKYDCIRIFFTGENISPNFNLCDYATGFDYLNFGDRYYRLPLYLITQFYSDEEIKLAGDPFFNEPETFTKKDLEGKKQFCSFVYSNYLGDKSREIFFNKLSEYKKVNAGGKYLNNINKNIQNKLEFELQHKFSIAFENSSRSGYTTEKITNSLSAKTIPIYWGNPDIHKEFNEKRFINCHTYRNFDEVISEIKKIDTNNNLYLEMINQPIRTNYNFELVLKEFEIFLTKIIDQPIDKARRRTINQARAMELEKNEKIVALIVSLRTKIKTLLAKLYRPVKSIRSIDSLKQRYFASKIITK